jgi:hypothetical protein
MPRHRFRAHQCKDVDNSDVGAVEVISEEVEADRELTSVRTGSHAAKTVTPNAKHLSLRFLDYTKNATAISTIIPQQVLLQSLRSGTNHLCSEHTQ